MACRLHAICGDDGVGASLPEGARAVVFRDLAAVVSDAPYVAAEPDEAMVAEHARIVGAAFALGELLPARPGTVFRDDPALQRWMELHYVALSDALTFVADRVAARVHVASVERDGAPGDSGTDLASRAAELMRILRRRAVAGVPLQREHTTGIAIGASFLVERALWKEFEAEVHAAGADDDAITVSVSGPWPPYDFVRFELGT